MLNLKNLLVKFIPGFLPLIVFVIAEEIWGLQTGLIVAVGFGILEFLFSWIKERKADYFILIDTALLLVLGGVSYLMHDEILLLLKPALIETILAVLLGVSAFSKYNIMMMMSKRYLKEIELTEAQLMEFSRNIKVIFFIILVHILLTVYAAFFLSHAAWAFVSGGLFFLFIGGFIIYQFLRYRYLKKCMEKEEWLPVVDENGGVKGKIPRSVCHGDQRIMHPVVHMHVLKNNSIFLQKRPEDKLIEPGKWDTAVGGHLSFGEDLENGLKRETLEEIGLTEFKHQFIVKYIWETDVETELVYCFITRDWKNIRINKKELDDGKFWPIHQIKENLGKGVFTPNFEKEFELLDQVFFSQKRG